MKTTKYFLGIFALALVISACQKDPLSEVNSGEWNNERSVLDIKFANQVGKASIERIDEVSGGISIAINVDAVPNLSSITILELQLSYGAESSVKKGDALNFENAGNSAVITVTSPTGKTRDYTIRATSFTENLIGVYNVTNLIVYGGTGPEYGGAAVLPMISKPWVWPAQGGPAADLDNIITFELTGITDEGNTYGIVRNDAGADGLFANFLFVGNPETDVNHFYRKIPAGEGQWLRNYANGTVVFTFPNGSTTTGVFATAGTEDLGHGQSKIITDYALAFSLNGTDDWDKIYSDYDKFVKRPRRYWIELNKQ